MARRKVALARGESGVAGDAGGEGTINRGYPVQTMFLSDINGAPEGR